MIVQAALVRSPAGRRKTSPPARIRSIWSVVWCVAALTLGGCDLSQSPAFKLNMEGRDPAQVSLAQKEAIRDALEQLFGTPDEPRVVEGSGLKLELLRMAAGPVAGEADGRQRGLFRRHCAGCHGISGDGAGPLATTFDPYPRDFRLGVFKFTSTRQDAKPLAEDLRRTVLRGIPGTGMPSFIELPPQEIDALVEYVKYLSLRGETERYLLELVVDEDEYLPLGSVAMESIREEGVLCVAESWALPERERRQYVIEPPPRPPVDTPQALAESIAQGRRLYAGKEAQCVKCHGPEGNGDGEEKELYDDWNKPKKGVTAAETQRLSRLYTLPIQRLRPRDFRRGAFRGGGRPEDLYRRIYAGIKGTPMPATGPMPGAAGVYTPEEIWHVVDYVLALSRGGVVP